MASYSIRTKEMAPYNTRRGQCVSLVAGVLLWQNCMLSVFMDEKCRSLIYVCKCININIIERILNQAGYFNFYIAYNKSFIEERIQLGDISLRHGHSSKFVLTRKQTEQCQKHCNEIPLNMLFAMDPQGTIGTALELFLQGEQELSGDCRGLEEYSN